jgi:hypothetical protein
MINNKQEFFKLLKYSNELRKNNKSLFKENPEKSIKLSRFLITKLMQKIFLFVSLQNMII